mgnify:CR=1 FL=1|jgi:hypothetical protein
MDDNSESDIEIDVGRLPAPEENRDAVPPVNMSTLLVSVGWVALGIRLCGIGKGIIELGFAISFLLLVMHYSNRLHRLKTQIANIGNGNQTRLNQRERYAHIGKNLLTVGLLLTIPQLLILEMEGNRIFDPYEPWPQITMILGMLCTISGFFVWLKHR